MDLEFLKKLQEVGFDLKKSFVSKDDRMPVIRQCAVLGISRSNFYHRPVISQKKLDLINEIDELCTEDSTRGQRRMRFALYNKYGIKVGRKLVRSIMRKLGINAVFPKKHLSIPDKQHLNQHRSGMPIHIERLHGYF